MARLGLPLVYIIDRQTDCRHTHTEYTRIEEMGSSRGPMRVYFRIARKLIIVLFHYNLSKEMKII